MLKLEIVTPERKVLSESVEWVTIPTVTGEISILPNHAPLISSLSPGVLSYSHSNFVGKLAVAGGFVEVNENKVSVLADVAEHDYEIDYEKARSEKEELEKNLSRWTGSEEEFKIEKDRLDLAQARFVCATQRRSS
jgi:F-type H+-transporting ATPase subunit epsilon